MKRILTVTLNPAIDFTVEVPGFSLDSVNRAKNSRRDPGGKGINVATALTEGALECDVTGFLGRDNSEIFENHFMKHGIHNRFIYVDGSTREGIKIADLTNRVTTDINFPGFDLNKKNIDNFLTEYTSMIDDYDYIILSGSLPQNVDVNIYSLLASINRERGKFTAVDASGISLLTSIESGNINLIKPNIDELEDIYPELKNSHNKEESLDNLIYSILEKVEMVALSLGHEGSKLYTRDGSYTINAPTIDVKSSVGAGDTYLAGFIAGLSQNKNLEETLKTAASWAASKLTMYGPGLSKEQPPQSFIESLVVEKH